MATRALLVGIFDGAAALSTILGTAVEVVPLRMADAAVRLREQGADLLILAVSGAPSAALQKLAQLRLAAQPGDVPILVLVPRNRPDLLVEAFDGGAADCAGLPLDGGEIKARVTALLRRKRASDVLTAQSRETQRLAQTDAVTGLYNRHYFDAKLDAAVASARARATPLSVLMLDIDLFKPVNDRFGHAAGDRALQAVARQLSASVRASDIVVRFGGDELVVLMPDTLLATAQRIAERLRQVVGETRVDGLNGEVAALLLTVSIGVAALEPGDSDGAALVARADAALYAAKRAGRNRVVTADSAAA